MRTHFQAIVGWMGGSQDPSLDRPFHLFIETHNQSILSVAGVERHPEEGSVTDDEYPAMSNYAVRNLPSAAAANNLQAYIVLIVYKRL